MDVTWILVADRERARLFAQEPGRETLEEIADYFNHGHAAGVELMRSMSRTHGRLIHHPSEPMHGTYDDTFARELATVLERGLHEQCYARLVLIAPARFLAALHAGLRKRVRACIAYEIDDDLTLAAARDIRAYLRPRHALGRAHRIELERG
jgi:protein required for attachment to host cells